MVQEGEGQPQIEVTIVPRKNSRGVCPKGVVE
jgi:hypothetical protein